MEVNKIKDKEEFKEAIRAYRNFEFIDSFQMFS